MGGQDLLFKTTVIDPYGIIVPFIFVGAGGWTKDLMNGKHPPFPPSWTPSPSTSLNFSISVLAPSGFTGECAGSFRSFKNLTVPVQGAPLPPADPQAPQGIIQ